jgi:hypothetical protein
MQNNFIPFFKKINMYYCATIVGVNQRMSSVDELRKLSKNFGAGNMKT